MKRVVFVVLLLAVVGVAACGDDSPSQPAVEVPPWAKVAPEQIAEAKKHGVPVAFENDLGMRFVLIPAGTFLMGSPEDEERRNDDERQHEVTITEPYYIQITTVTNAQYARYKPDHDSGHDEGYTLNGASQPAVLVNYEDATRFCAWLSSRERGRSYRLPTEAQWERACRAGTEGPYYWGESRADADLHVAGYPYRKGSAPVATHQPNPWGLYDMLGNV